MWQFLSFRAAAAVLLPWSILQFIFLCCCSYTHTMILIHCRSFMFLWCCSCTLTLILIAVSYFCAAAGVLLPWSLLQFNVSVLLQLYSYPDPYCSFIFMWYCSCTLILIAVSYLCGAAVVPLSLLQFIFLCCCSCTLTLILIVNSYFSATEAVIIPCLSFMFVCCCSCTRSWLCPAFSSSIPPPAWISRYPF